MNCKAIVGLALVLVNFTSSVDSNPFQIFRRHSVPGWLDPLSSLRQGRNSKLMKMGDFPTVSPLSLTDVVTFSPESSEKEEDMVEEEYAPKMKEETQEMEENKVADVSLIDMDEDLTDKLMDDLLNELVEDEEERGGKQHEDKIGLPEHEFVIEQERSDASNQLLTPGVQVKTIPLEDLPPQMLIQLATNEPQPQLSEELPKTITLIQKNGVFTDQFGNTFKSQGYPQLEEQKYKGLFENAKARSSLLNEFGPNMGENLIADPDNNSFAATPQLERLSLDGAEDRMTNAELDQNDVDSRQVDPEASTTTETTVDESTAAAESGAVEGINGAETTDKNGLRCVNKVMQVEETVYDTRVKCTHSFTEKCHDTFITDYVPTQEKKCETSFKKNCQITYKPMAFDEVVEICDEPLEKVCNDDIIGPEVCQTHYETTCETRYKEHEVEQDEPVCEMVIERKCNGVAVEVPEQGSGARRRRQAGNRFESSRQFDLVSVGNDCEEWPIQKCRLEKKLVKKSNPETSCAKVPKEICAPSNCQFVQSNKKCREEKRSLVQNIPSEQCDLEPNETCKMETVLVPRLIQQPNCIKVPKEICVNAKTNPRKVSKPVIKEWCYRPADLEAQSSRLALSQFFNNRR